MRVNTAACFSDVESVLQHYHQFAALEQHRAQHWPAVAEHVRRGAHPTAALRQLLDQALHLLETQDATASALLRHYYVDRHLPPAPTAADPSPSLPDRCTHTAVQDLTTIITALNEACTRRHQAQRFQPQRPVVGLDQQALQIHRQLRDPHAPLLTVITGGDGLGKSTLARLVATHCANDALFAGVLWANARQIEADCWAGQPRRTPASPLNPDDLLQELARELALDMPTDLATLRAEVGAHCQLSRYLIVLDNLERSTDLATLRPLIELLSGTSQLLVATRNDAAPALPDALSWTQVQLGELNAATSSQLLRMAALSINAERLAQASDDELAQIYAVIGGHPLALWLIAGLAGQMPWEDLLHWLRQQHGIQQTEQLYDQIYRQVWAQLSDAARMVLFAMHRCDSGAEYALLLELSMLDQTTFAAAIEELRQRTLMAFDGCYTIHRLTYTFLRVVVAGWCDG